MEALSTSYWPPSMSLSPPRELPNVRTNDFDSGSPEKLEQWALERSPRLNENPNATLDTSTEIEWYHRQLECIGRDGNYLRAIESIIQREQSLRAIDPDTNALICIPVAAASEYDSIFGTLSLYAQQNTDITKNVTILIHANWTESAAKDSVIADRIQLTLSEIERAKQAHPHLNLAYFTSEFEKDFVDEHGGIVGEAVRRLYDVGLMTVRQMKSNGQAPDKDVLLIRNDSDALGMDRRYLEHLINASDNYSGSDAFTGAVRWDTHSHTSYPGFGAVTNFREIMHAVTALRNVKAPIMTVGINSAVRASTLAAIGSLGRGKYTGVGSDDREMGMRILNARQSSKVSSIGSLALNDQPRRPITYVAGIGIDTTANRLLGTYLRNMPITRAWDDFDDGGYTGRRTVNNLPGELEDSEALDLIANRVEININSMINEWFKSRDHINMGLAFTFPENFEGECVYHLSVNEGEYNFRLTSKGREWLGERIVRRPVNQHETYGNRIVRQLYEPSNSRPSRFVSRDSMKFEPSNQS